MILKKIFSKALLLGFSLFVSFAANAELTQVSVLITEDKTDCSGKNAYFDDPNTKDRSFNDCRIFVEDGNNVISYLSDVIIKFNLNNDNNFYVGEDSISSQYEGEIEGGDFTTLSFDDNTNTSGKWVYNNGEYTYPDIRFWTAKAGNNFLLLWQVDLSETPDNCLTGTHDFNLSYACMNLSQSVTEGTWSTPYNNANGLSHITFFGGLCSEDDTNFDSNCGGTTTTNVPEPTSIALFTLALFGIATRRKSSISK